MQFVSYYTLFVAFLLTAMNYMENYVCCSYQTNGVVSLTKSLVWGPGLNVDSVLPVRYFFIQPVDAEGHKYVSLIVIAWKSDSAVNRQRNVVNTSLLVIIWGSGFVQAHHYRTRKPARSRYRLLAFDGSQHRSVFVQPKKHAQKLELLWNSFILFLSAFYVLLCAYIFATV